MTLLIIFFLFSILFSFLCSIWEAVLLSTTPSYSKGLARKGNSTGEFFEKAKKDIDRPLSAILTLNTIAHTVGAIGVGAQAGKVFGDNFVNILGFHLSYESIIAGAMTLAILILSEIIPKTLGANNWKTLAPFTAKSLKFLLILLAPFVWLSQIITNSLKKNKDESVLSRSDYMVMTQTAGESGELQKSEYKIIKNLLNFEELKAEDIMTPRTVMKMANENLKIQDYYDSQDHNLPFSRIPVYNSGPDDVTGILLKDELMQAIIHGEGDQKLSDIKREVSMVNENLTLPLLFEHLVQKNKHLSVVVDDYGMIQGLVTMEDLIETLLGSEIVDESDNIADLQQYARKKWKDRATKLGIIEDINISEDKTKEVNAIHKNNTEDNNNKDAQ